MSTRRSGSVTVISGSTGPRYRLIHGRDGSRAFLRDASHWGSARDGFRYPPPDVAHSLPGTPIFGRASAARSCCLRRSLHACSGTPTLVYVAEPQALRGDPKYLEPAEATSVPAGPGSSANQIAAARRHIDHIVFLIKENRTFDNLFARFPGADGATQGTKCDGTTVTLQRAVDREPELGHSFTDGITAVNGGAMNCFTDGATSPTMTRGHPQLLGIRQAVRAGGSFFSSVYGPTGIEHLWTFASQSTGSWTMSGPGSSGPPDESLRRPRRGRVLVPPDVPTRAGERRTFWTRGEGPGGIAAVRESWVSRWPCLDVKVLPISSTPTE